MSPNVTPMWIEGAGVDADEHTVVSSPYDGRELGRVPTGTEEHVNRAVAAALKRHRAGALPAHERAEILDRAHQENLEGTFHVGGAERVSPLKFAQRLADQFDRPWLALRRETTLNEAAHGFGAGECSLQTKKIRKALCVAMPLLSEGLARLEAQHVNGYRERLTGASTPVQLRAA